MLKSSHIALLTNALRHAILLALCIISSPKIEISRTKMIICRNFGTLVDFSLSEWYLVE